MGEKPDDRWTLPLCSMHHYFQHKNGERIFWGSMAQDPLALTSALQINFGDSQAAEDIFRAWRELRNGTLATT